MARKSLRKLGTLKEEIFAEEIFADFCLMREIKFREI